MSTVQPEQSMKSPARGAQIFDLTPQLVQDGDFIDPHEVVVRWWHYVPVLNILWDILMDQAPTPDQITSLMNIIGLMDALLLSMIIGVPFSYGHDDYTAAIARMGGDEANYQLVFHKYIWSVASLTCSLIITAFVLISLMTTSFRGPDLRSNAYMLQNWWKFVRVIVTTSLVTMIFGIVWSMQTIEGLMALMLPRMSTSSFAADATWDDRNRPTSGPPFFVAARWSHTDDPQLYFSVVMTFMVVGIGVLFTIGCLAVALSIKTRTYVLVHTRQDPSLARMLNCTPCQTVWGSELEDLASMGFASNNRDDCERYSQLMTEHGSLKQALPYIIRQSVETAKASYDALKSELLAVGFSEEEFHFKDDEVDIQTAIIAAHFEYKKCVQILMSNRVRASINKT